MEVWKDIGIIKGIDFTNYYQVSNIGNIRSMINQRYMTKRYNPKILKKGNLEGYKTIGLRKDKILKRIKIHRIVGITFIPNPENKPCINHINGIKDDNRVENLEWATYSENEIHSYKILGKKANKPWLGKSGKDSPVSKQINQYDLEGNFIKTYCSITEAEKINNILKQNISKVCKGKRNQAGGYKWSYA